MNIETLALIFYVVLVILGLITIWLQFPGTMLILGAAIVYDLFVRSTDLPWEAYLIMFSFMAVGEIGDIILTSYMKKSPKAASFLKLVMATGMIVAFVVTL